MVPKGYNTLRALIETRYGILSQLISNVEKHYHSPWIDFQNYVIKTAKENCDGDNEIYFSILHSFDTEEEILESLLKETRRILFCSIFSYYENMLNEILSYYGIATKAQQVKQVFEVIKKEYKNRYSEELIADAASDFYRLLRNYFMHGKLSSYKDYVKLHSFVGATDGIKLYGNMSIDITDNSFLLKSLNDLRRILVDIEESFTLKITEEWMTLKRVKEYISEIIKLYPPEYPGLEDEYPPYCSIKVHKLILEAEKECLQIAKRGNAEAQLLLSRLYLNLYEIPNKKRGLIWLRKSASQGQKDAIEILSELSNDKTI